MVLRPTPRHMSVFQIRELKATDFDDVEDAFFSFFPEAEADPSFGLTLFRVRPTREEERKWFEGHLRDIQTGKVVKRVAEVDSHVVGWCDVRNVLWGTPLDHRGTLGISIRKGFRGRGIGTALITEIIEASRGKFESIELTVLSSNKTAVKLYEKFGFRKIGTIPNAVKRGGRYFDEDLMYLRL